MNLKEISDLLSTLLADSSINFYTQNERLQAINSACTFLNSELRILKQTVEVTLSTTNMGRVPIPSDFVSLTGPLQWKDLNGTLTTLQFAVPNQLLSNSWNTETGTPSRYVMEGGNIFVTPVPTQAGTIVLSYVAMPNKLLQDGDIPFYGDPRTQAYHEIIAYYAAWQLTLKDRDFEAAQQFMQYFQARMIDLKENMRHTGGLIQPVWNDVYAVT